MRLVQTVLLIAATITTGLMAGLFAAFAYAVMPALNGADDRTLSAVMPMCGCVISRRLMSGGYVLAPQHRSRAGVDRGD